MKVYGSHICIDCRNYQALQARRGFAAEFIDITANTADFGIYYKDTLLTLAKTAKFPAGT